MAKTVSNSCEVLGLLFLALSLPTGRAEEKDRIIGTTAFLAYHLHLRLCGYGSNWGKRRSDRWWIRDKHPDYRGYYSSDEYYSTENEIDKVIHASKNVSGQDGP